MIAPWRGWALAAVLAGCAPPGRAEAPARIAPRPEPAVAATPVPPPARPAPERRPPPPRWLRGSTHVHAAPSGDSGTSPERVIAWYEARGYDFVVLTDHNRVTTVADASAGRTFVRFPDTGLIVIAGIELTFNPATCQPAPPAPEGKCRIHVNVLGPTARPVGKLEWADRKHPERVAMYGRALEEAAMLGGIAQLNHPQWHWGTTPELLAQLTARGLTLMEIANVQFARWNAGGDGHPSTEALWDAALTAGATLWGLASDDAHDYFADGSGRYPAGGGWVMVDAPRDPDAILRAIATGRFYASTGVSLTRAEVWDDALEIEVASPGTGQHLIRYIGTGGRVLLDVTADRARFPLTGVSGYVRAVVIRDDGARAWIQPVRR